MTSLAAVRSPPAGYDPTADRASASAALNASRSFCSADTCTARNRVLRSSDGGAETRFGSGACASAITRGGAVTRPSAHSGGTGACGLFSTVTVGLSWANALTALAATTRANHVAGRRTAIILQASPSRLFDLRAVARHVFRHLNVWKRARELLLCLVVAADLIKGDSLVEPEILLSSQERAEFLQSAKGIGVVAGAIQPSRRGGHCVARHVRSTQ